MKRDQRKHNNPNYIHGQSSTRFYAVWGSMIARCHNQKNRGYKYYGAKGVRVCPRWHTFVNFYNDMFTSYELGLQLDRINTHKSYSKNNCRWVSTKVLARNRRDNVWITYNGSTKILRDWSKELGIHYETLRARLKKGYSTEIVLTKGRINKYDIT